MSLITTVTRRAIMQLFVLIIKKQKINLYLDNFFFNNCGQHEGSNATSTYILH